MRRWLTIPLLLAAASCGDDTVSATGELDEACGQTSPVQIVEFELGRAVVRAIQSWVGEGRRVVYIRYADSDASEWWSLGLCGEDPTLIHVGGDSLSALPDGTLAIHDSQTYTIIDPTGTQPPRALFEPVSNGFHSTSAGLVTVAVNANHEVSVLLHRWPEHPWTDEVQSEILFDGVGDAEVGRWDVVASDDDEVFIYTLADELVRVAFADGSVQLIASDVRTFDAGYGHDGQIHSLLWQGRGPSDDSEAPKGPVTLLDWQTKQATDLGTLAVSDPGLGPMRWSHAGLLQLPIETTDGTVHRLYELDTLAYIELPEPLILGYMLADERHFVVSRKTEPHPSYSVLLDRHTGVLESLPPGPRRRWFEVQSLVIVDLPAGQTNPHADGELRLLTDGGPPKRLAARATHYSHQTPDNRVLTTVGLEGDVGELILVEPETRAETTIDYGVHGMHLSTLQAFEGDTSVVYRIADGVRDGLWLARVLPR